MRYDFLNTKSVHTHNWYVDSCPPSKTDTCILFDANEELVAFGHDAKEEYLRICEGEKEDDYLYFSNFKMVLYENSVRNETLNRYSLPVILVIQIKTSTKMYTPF